VKLLKSWMDIGNERHCSDFSLIVPNNLLPPNGIAAQREKGAGDTSPQSRHGLKCPVHNSSRAVHGHLLIGVLPPVWKVSGAKFLEWWHSGMVALRENGTQRKLIYSIVQKQKENVWTLSDSNIIARTGIGCNSRPVGLFSLFLFCSVLPMQRNVDSTCSELRACTGRTNHQIE
jgi:hypothetical protein